jgi:hypothetical protein
LGSTFVGLRLKSLGGLFDQAISVDSAGLNGEFSEAKGESPALLPDSLLAHLQVVTGETSRRAPRPL